MAGTMSAIVQGLGFRDNECTEGTTGSEPGLLPFNTEPNRTHLVLSAMQNSVFGPHSAFLGPMSKSRSLRLPVCSVGCARFGQSGGGSEPADTRARCSKWTHDQIAHCAPTHLHDVDRVNGGVAHLNEPPQRGVVLAQPLVSGDLAAHTSPDRQTQTVTPLPAARRCGIGRDPTTKVWTPASDKPQCLRTMPPTTAPALPERQTSASHDAPDARRQK
jgi:hypothetical protein